MKTKNILIIFILIFLFYHRSYADESFSSKTQLSYSIILTETGFIPEQISLFEKEWVSLFLTNTASENSCFILSDKEIHLSVQPGKIVATKIYFEKPGLYSFYCPLYQVKGTIRVLKKDLYALKENEKKEMRREISSQANLDHYFIDQDRYWIPKDRERFVDN